MTTRNKGLTQAIPALRDTKTKKGKTPDKRITAYRQAVAKVASTYPVKDMDKHINLFCAATGGGKTLSGSILAIRSALKFGKTKIIYATPYILLTQQAESAIKEKITEEIAAVVASHSKKRHVDKKEENTAKKLGFDVNICTIRKLEMVLCATKPKRNSDSLTKKMWEARQNLLQSTLIIDDASQHLTAEITPALMMLLDKLRQEGAIVILSSGSLPDYRKLDKELGENYIHRDIPLRRIGHNIPEGEILKKRHQVVIHRKITLTDATDILIRAEGPQLVICETIAKTLAIFNHLKKQKKAFHGVKMFLLNGSQSEHDRKKLTTAVEKHLGGTNPEKIIVVSTSVAQCGWDVSFAGGINDIFSYSGAVEHGGRINRNFEYKKGILHVGPIEIEDIHPNPGVMFSKTAALLTMEENIAGKNTEKLGIRPEGTTRALRYELQYQQQKIWEKAVELETEAKEGNLEKLDSELRKRYRNKRNTRYFPDVKSLGKALQTLQKELKKRGVRVQLIAPNELNITGTLEEMSPQEVIAAVDETLDHYASNMSESQVNKIGNDQLIPLKLCHKGKTEETKYFLLLMIPEK